MPDALPIADHGLVGDLRTCALVGTDATVDWFCAPRFDSPSVFGAMLDPEQGGTWLSSSPADGSVPDGHDAVPFLRTPPCWSRAS